MKETTGKVKSRGQNPDVTTAFTELNICHVSGGFCETWLFLDVYFSKFCILKDPPTLLPEKRKNDNLAQFTGHDLSSSLIPWYLVSTEFTITPVLEIYPESDIYEGDSLNVTCTIRNHLFSIGRGDLYLSQGTKLLRTGASVVTYPMVAQSHHSGDFECRLEVGSVEKVTSKRISVTGEWAEEEKPDVELFSLVWVFVSHYVSEICPQSFSPCPSSPYRQLTSFKETISH